MFISRDVLNRDKFLAKDFVSGNFLQSTIWKDFLELQGKKFWQLTVTDQNKEIIAICLLYENRLWFGKSYLYAPKGPVFVAGATESEKQEALALILSQIRDITIATHKYEELFCKLEPSEAILSPPELINSSAVQPHDTLVLDLGEEPKELLAKMHPKTRYNIALANKKGIKIKASQEEEDIKYFLQLIKKTADRQQINTHSDQYYKLLWKALLKNKTGRLYLARAEDKIIAANLLIEFGRTVTYLHGASDYQYRQYMAPHLLQWQAIKDATEQGFEIYDFWGIAPKDRSKPNWEGLTRFKKGFGGRRVSYPGVKIFVYNKQWYRFYLWAKKIIRFIKK